MNPARSLTAAAELLCSALLSHPAYLCPLPAPATTTADRQCHILMLF
jgi:hypothetical protein